MKKIFLGVFIASVYMPLALADTCEEPKLTGREGYSTVDCLSEEGLSMVTKPGNKKAPYLYGFVNKAPFAFLFGRSKTLCKITRQILKFQRNHFFTTGVDVAA